MQRKIPKETPWYTTDRFKKNILLLTLCIIVYQGIMGIFIRKNDFLVHYDLGRYFLQKDMAHHPAGAPNTTGRLMMNALLGIQNYTMARAVTFFIALAALVSSLKMWNRMANERMRVSDPIAFASAVFSLVLLIHFVLRDLDDCGLQIILLFFLTSAAYALYSGRSMVCGFWLGIAATYKATPLLFFPFLLWKRKWKPALWMLVFIIFLNVIAPALYLGWDNSISSNLKWLERGKHELSVQDPMHPASFEEPRHQNQTLTFAIARYLQTVPPGHPLYIDHPLFIQIGNLDKKTTGYIVKGILFAFAAALAWRFRRPWEGREKVEHFAVEWAAVILLCAILSPLNWIYHYVLALPSVFFIFRFHLQNYNIPKWRIYTLAAIAFKILILHRFFLGRDLSIIMLSYKFDAFAMLLIVMLVLTLTTDSTPAVQEEINKQ